ISEIPAVKQKLGEMELRMLESSTFLYAAAKKWDEADEETRASMKTELGAVKLWVVNKALETVDLAMRIARGRSLTAQSQPQRYYRDARAGLDNPQIDDMTIIALANETISKRA